MKTNENYNNWCRRLISTFLHAEINIYYIKYMYSYTIITFPQPVMEVTVLMFLLSGLLSLAGSCRNDGSNFSCDLIGQ